MSIDDLTFEQIKQIAAMCGNCNDPTTIATLHNGSQPGQYVIVRASAAGVHAGILVGVDRVNKIVWLRDSRRLWRWWSRLSLNELASEGVLAGKASECKFSAPSPETVEIALWCEIRPCSSAAEKTIREVPNANA